MTTSDTRIVVGFDGSDDALAALAFGAREALARSGELRIIFAIDDTVLNSTWGIVFDVESVRQTGEEMLGEARKVAMGLGVPDDAIVTDTLAGPPASVLRKASESASLVVVGRRSEAGSHSMFVGSTAVGLAGTAGCPVVMASQLIGESEPSGVIGVGLDPSARGVVAVEWAVRRAARLGARVQVLTVLKKPQSRLFARGPVTDEQAAIAVEDVRRRVQAAVDEAVGDADVVVDVEVRYGSPIEQLVAASKDMDMMILGVHPSFPTFGLGGVVRGLMAHAECTLGLIRHK